MKGLVFSAYVLNREVVKSSSIRVVENEFFGREGSNRNDRSGTAFEATVATDSGRGGVWYAASLPGSVPFRTTLHNCYCSTLTSAVGTVFEPLGDLGRYTQ